MKDILFYKDLYDPLDNKGDKPVVTKDEEWKKMNHKAIGQIRQWIRHKVFNHVAQETSAYELWTQLEEMYQAKIYQNKNLIDEKTREFEASRETIVVEHTSEF